MQTEKHNTTADLGQDMSKKTSAYQSDFESQHLSKFLNDGISFAINSAEMKADNLKTINTLKEKGVKRNVQHASQQ